METNQNPDPGTDRKSDQKLEALLWVILVILVMVLLSVIVVRNRDTIRTFFRQGLIKNFNVVEISNSAHDFSLPNGYSWKVSYETYQERIFSGLVRHSSPINESSFAILTFDILVTSGQFSDADLVTTSVNNHHFNWRAPSLTNPEGTINLLHTLPLNERIRQQLQAINIGDQVEIQGYEIYRINGFDAEGRSLGFWQDSGCNTLLVTGVTVQQ